MSDCSSAAGRWIALSPESVCPILQRVGRRHPSPTDNLPKRAQAAARARYLIDLTQLLKGASVIACHRGAGAVRPGRGRRREIANRPLPPPERKPIGLRNPPRQNFPE
jgi:hypothetical protein